MKTAPGIRIDRQRCKGCLLCVSFCPRQAIEADNQLNAYGCRPAKFKKGAACLGCALCALVCPDCCIEVYK